METKTYIWIGITIGGFVGGALGALIDHGNAFGGWSILMTAIGSIAGLWAGYKLANG